MILNEGGNVFANTEPFDQKFVPNILDTINRALKSTGIEAIPVGSAATPKEGRQSGDMDVVVDEASVLEFFKAKDAKSGRKALNDFIQQQGLETAQSGINVHVNVPVGKAHHQVDIMVTANAPTVAKFHTHDIPHGSPYKGVHKQLMMAILAKQKGYMWSAWQGLFSRTSEGKKGDFVTDDLNKIAQLLLGDNASAANLSSVENIMRAMPDDQAAALLDRARQDPNWKEVKVNEELIRIKHLAGLKEQTTQPPIMPNIQGLTPGQSKDLGAGNKVTLNADGTISYTGGWGTYVYNAQGKAIKHISPNLAGAGQSTDLTTNKTSTSYNDGPLSVKKGPDGEVDAQYDLGLGVAKMSKDAQGKTGGNYIPRTESKLSRNDPLNQSLEAMLSIARLR